ncbi:MAG: metallophosphoesterase [Novosphingobium sp.]|nr:metallophosphoesterase [Novosphingobium sp.]MBX9645374.1 metallophosphoesterase [Novosphingobium sp.]
MVTLLHVSDLHFGSEDRDALDWFAETVQRDRPAAVLCTGDLTMRGSAREYALAQAWLARLPVPVALVPGNHDVPYYHHMVRRLTAPYSHYRALEAALTLPDLPALALVPLKTIARAQLRLNWSKGRVSNKDLDAATTALERQRDRPLRIVMGHHPLVDADTASSGSTKGGKRALAALARAGAQVVLSGHVHDAFDMTIEADGLPVRLIGAGTLSQRLRSTPPSFNRLVWDGEVLKLEQQSLS